MIAQNLQKQIGEAMKAGDKTRVETLRMLSSTFNYEKIELKHDLSEEEEIGVIRKQAKQRKESIEAFEKANRPDLAIPEKAQLEILSEFLPPEMEEGELVKLVDLVIGETGAKTVVDMGKVIDLVKAKAPNAEGAKVAALVRDKLIANG